LASIKTIVSAMATIFERVEPGERKKNKRNILSSALACFNELGIEATTIDHIRERSGSSTGSIYHHFGNKEGLVAALFFAALTDQEQQINAAVSQANCAKEAIKAIVHTYLTWVTEHPDLAHFVFRAHSVISNSAHREQLKARNKDVYKPLFLLFKAAQDKGEIKTLPVETIASILVGPAENYSRAWLAKRVKETPLHHANILAEAAWSAFVRE